MVRRLFLAFCTLALFLPLGVSCSTQEPVLWSWPHNKRRIMTVLNGLQEFHMDVDRIIFDMEEYPVEPDY